MSEQRDQYHGEGGSYLMKDGKRVRVIEPTRDHPEGNRARDKDGRALDTPAPSTTEAQPSGNVKSIRGKPAPGDE